MKKKVLILGLIAVVVGAGVFGISRFFYTEKDIETVTDTLTEQGQPSDVSKKSGLDIKAKGAALIDAKTGQVIYEQDAHKELEPASVTKIMTMLLAMEGCKSGRISLTDQVTISDHAASMGGSQMYMEPGETHTLEELLKGMAMVSANDASVAVAEYVYGSEEIFVEHMNKRAKELGMMDTHFVNTNGLPVAEHCTSAYDIAIMSKCLLEYPQVSKWLTCWQDTIKVGLPGKEKEFGLSNTNKLLKQYPGACGIKTGFTSQAGFCLSGAAIKGDTTLIAVVLGCETSKIRFQEISKLFNFGFANYSSVILASKGQALSKVVIEKGEPDSIKGVCSQQICVTARKGQEKNYTYKTYVNKDIKLPVKKGDKVGKVCVYCGKKKVNTFPLVSDSSVKKVAITTYYIRKIRKLFD